MPKFNVHAIRAKIPALDKSIYMNTAGTGPLPVSVVTDLTNMYKDIFENGPDNPIVKDAAIQEFEKTRQLSASLLGVDSDEIALFRAISEGISTVAYGIEWNPGDEVIISNEEHPTGIIVWLNLAKRKGIKIKKLPISSNKAKLLDDLSNLITDNTRLLAMSHVTTDTGTRLPAKEICALAHSRSVPVLLDGAQSVGQFPVDLREIDVDWYACTGHKWLLGGWGTSIFYVNKYRSPKIEVSWSGSRAAEWDINTDNLVFPKSARKFEFGGRALPLYNGMRAGIEFVQDIGIENIETQSRILSDKLMSALSEIKRATVLSPEHRSFSTGIVTFSVEGLSGKELSAQMFDRWRILGRPTLDQTGMRVCCAFFNTDQEIDIVINAVNALANESR